ncbi:MAG TPA: CHRD domain-containing protein, partial [Gaiellaceae bacterium]|nr:CHRD domain-containing protein [Gaiellaceae bacterium]
AALTAALVTSLALAAVATAKGGHLTAALRGTNEVPSAPASNRGRAEIRLNAATGKVCWDFTITKIDGAGNAAHIHKGRPGASGPVYIPLGTTFKRQGCTSAPKAKIRAVAANPTAFYVNIHNAKHPAGAMRGQLKADL